MHIKWIFLFGCLIFFLSNCENALVRRTTSGGNSGSRIRNRSGYSPKRASGVSSSKGTNYYRGTTRYQPRLASAPPPPPPPPPPAALHGGNFRRPGNKRPIQPIAKPMDASPAITRIGVVPTFHSAPKVNASRPLYPAQQGNGRRNKTQQWPQTKFNASRPHYPAQHGNGHRNNTQQWPQARTNRNATAFGGNVRHNNTQQWPQTRPTFNATRVGNNFRNTSLNAFPYNTRPNTNLTRNATHIGAGGRPAQLTTNEIIPKVFVGSQNSAPSPSNPSININVNVPASGQQSNPEKSNKKTNWVSQAWKGIKDKFNSNPKKETRTTITHSLAKGPPNHVVETFADYSWDDVNADVRLAGTTKSAQKSITNKILIFSGCAVLVLLAVSLIAYFYARNRRSADLN